MLESQSRTGTSKTNKENYHLKLCMSCLSCLSAAFAPQRGGFVPREWLAAKGLLLIIKKCVEAFELSCGRDESYGKVQIYLVRELKTR